MEIFNYKYVLIRIFTFCIFLLSFKTIIAQSYSQQQYEIFAYNILSSGLICGIGSVFNKEKNEKILPVFVKNFGKGCLGGFVKYSAKNQAYYLNNRQNTYLAPFNRLYFFVGHSICMNSAMNKKMLDAYYCNLYGLNFKFQIPKDNSPKLSLRLSLGTMVSAATFFNDGHKFNFYKSLEYGLLYYDLNPNSNYNGISLDGFATYNNFAIRNVNHAMSVIPHEIVHVYQFYDFFPVSGIYKMRTDRYLNSNKTYSFISKFIDFDYEPLFWIGLYNIQPEPTYYRNFFEYEAEHFGRRSYIRR